MSVAAFLFGVTLLTAAAAPAAAQAGAQSSTDPASRAADAYSQFMLGRHLETADDIPGAIAAFKRGLQLDPQGADIAAELAGLYMRQSRLEEAVQAGDQALKIDPANREAHRVLGIVYATLVESGRRNNQRTPQTATSMADNLAKAIEHLEKSIDRQVDSDPNVRATLSRLYLASGQNEKAIPLLQELVSQEPGWGDGPALLAQAYAGAGRDAEAIAWLEKSAGDDPDLYTTLAGFYERQKRWKDAANAYAKALAFSPRNVDLKLQYATALINIGGKDALTGARDALNDIVSARPNDVRSLFQLSQVQRRLGDLEAAESAARRVITLNGRSPMGYYALAMALEERRNYQAVVDALSPAADSFRANPGNNPAADLGLLLPHLGFAYQELGEFDKAVATFDEAHKLAPTDATVTAYLAQANLSAKKYSAVIELTRKAREDNPDELRFVRLEAQALRQSGKADEAVGLMQEFAKKQNKPESYIALAQVYSDSKRAADAVKVLQDAQTKFPDDTNIGFELGAVYDKQKKFADAEAAFRQVLMKEPDNAPALNYIGYMLAERGERLNESVDLLKKALALEPGNGSYLDSLGWAYYKSDRLPQALDNLQRAADQLKSNSVIQDHYGDVLYKLSRYDDAIAAWTRALSGDNDTIDRPAIDRKIRTAKQKLGRK
ncbi:MAG TPA: tetratricopeptide repeat protein [Vicinamibacterales bacterium]|nr:tetratricopeptide repeat protein [Vicinamibacterales bacterium]